MCWPTPPPDSPWPASRTSEGLRGRRQTARRMADLLPAARLGYHRAMRVGSQLFAIACLIGVQGAMVGAWSQADRADYEFFPPSPSFMFEGLRSGESRRFPSPVPLPAGWQNEISQGGTIDAQHFAGAYRALRLHVLRNDPYNRPRMDFRLACLVDGVGEQSTDAGYCPAEDLIPRSRYLRAIRLELFGPDADQFALSYRCWSAHRGDTENLADQGEKTSGEWCGLDQIDHWLTRIVVRVRRPGP
jgi:hypothetical protein